MIGSATAVLVNSVTSPGSVYSGVGTNIDGVDLKSTLVFTQPVGTPNQTFTINGNVYTLALTGFQNVDVRHGFLAGPGNDELHVFEGDSGSADLYGKVTLASNNPTTVPEPSQSAVLLVGVLGLGATLVARRRKTISAS